MNPHLIRHTAQRNTAALLQPCSDPEPLACNQGAARVKAATSVKDPRPTSLDMFNKRVALALPPPHGTAKPSIRPGEDAVAALLAIDVLPLVAPAVGEFQATRAMDPVLADAGLRQICRAHAARMHAFSGAIADTHPTVHAHTRQGPQHYPSRCDGSCFCRWWSQGCLHVHACRHHRGHQPP